MLTQAALRRLLSYNVRTGAFTWLVNGKGRFLRKGRRAGYINQTGHRMIMIAGKNYHASRLAYFYMRGQWPPVQMDHKNRKPADDRWRNLRPATASQNTCNRRGKRSKFKGVTRVGVRYKARIQVGRKNTHLGYFDTEKEAYAAYVAAGRKFHGEFFIST